MPSLFQFTDHVEHGFNVFGGSGTMLHCFNSERLEVLEKCLYIGTGELLDGFAFFQRIVYDLVVYIRDVRGMIQTVPPKSQVSSKLIHKDVSAEIADVIEVVDRGPAVIDAHPVRIGGLERLFFSGQRIEYGETHLYERKKEPPGLSIQARTVDAVRDPVMHIILMRNPAVVSALRFGNVFQKMIEVPVVITCFPFL